MKTGGVNYAVGLKWFLWMFGYFLKNLSLLEPILSAMNPGYSLSSLFYKPFTAFL